MPYIDTIRDALLAYYDQVYEDNTLEVDEQNKKLAEISEALTFIRSIDTEEL